MTLTDFLLARISEDDAVARAATPGPWRDCPMGSEGSNVYAGGETIRTARRPARCGEFTDAAHIARHDPARVLAECKAKRRIVEHHRAEPFADDPDDFYCRVCEEGIGGFHPCPTLRLLALPYADHEDFREEWRP